MSTICLGIESTAHTFGVGIIGSDGKILANVRDSYTTEKGGINPTDAKLHHERVADDTINKAVADSGIRLDDIGLVSFSQGPGLPPCLLVGMRKAKELAAKIKKPLVGVNHCVAHLEIGRRLTKAKDPAFLFVSGANTQVIAYESGKYRIFGETLDQGVGNMLDSFARYIGLGFPGGPKIYELALKGKEYIELPYIVKGMDVCVSGILTNIKHKFDSGKYRTEDLCFSVQETVFAMLAEITERAMAHCDKDEVLIGGGVGCNKRLQEMIGNMCDERGAKFFAPAMESLVDNGLMIAWLGILAKKEAKKDFGKIDIMPGWRTDEVMVSWM